MATFPHGNSLTALQRDLLTAFFARETRLFLTGGAALAGFYLGHRGTEDLDLFSPPGLDLAEAEHALIAAAHAVGATVTPKTTYPDFRRSIVTRGDETCIVDLVIDRIPPVDAQKARFDTCVVDTMREMAANKITTLLSRSEIKDLVALLALIDAGVDLEQAFADARRKDAGADPATLAWLLDQISIAPEARLPGGTTPARLLELRDALVVNLRARAFREVPHDPS
jgi:hypothetical protein